MVNSIVGNMYYSNKFSCRMLSSLLAVVMLLLMPMLQTSGEIEVSVTPAQMLLGLTTSLDVNCTFSNTNSGMAEIISLTVSRGDDTELAIITIFSNNQTNVMANENLTADGVISANNLSYLHLHWNLPNDTQNGTYKCVASGLDSSGHNVETVNTSVVTSNQATMQDLIDEMGKLQRTQDHIVQLEDRMASLEADIEKKMSAVFLVPPLSYRDSLYYVSKAGFQDIEESYAICKVYGGIVAEMDDYFEYYAVQDYLKTTSGITLAYIGGTDEQSDGNWVYPSNANRRFWVTDWYGGGEPSRSDVYNCVSLNRLHDWRMVSYSCHFGRIDPSKRYICEMSKL